MRPTPQFLIGSYERLSNLPVQCGRLELDLVSCRLAATEPLADNRSQCLF